LSRMPFLDGLALNYRIFVFAACLALFAAILFGAVPILRAPASDVRDDLAEGGRGTVSRLWRRFGANLVVVELAIAVVLLAAAGLLGKSFYRLLHVDFGFHPEHLAALRVSVPPALYKSDQQKIVFARDVVSRIRALPGVQSVGLTSLPPVSGNGNTDWIRVVGHPFNGEHNEVNEREVSSDYFKTIHAQLLRGRLLTQQDDATRPRVTVINKAFADKYLPGEDPIGKKYGNGALAPDSIKEIVGIVDNIRESSLDEAIWPAEYKAYNQDPDSFYALVVRTSGDPKSILPSLSTAVHQVDPGIGTF